MDKLKLKPCSCGSKYVNIVKEGTARICLNSVYWDDVCELKYQSPGYWSDEVYYFVNCLECGEASEKYKTIDKAVEDWNERMFERCDMKDFEYLEKNYTPPISIPRIERIHYIQKGCFRDSNRVDTVKPGTLISIGEKKIESEEEDKDDGTRIDG